MKRLSLLGVIASFALFFAVGGTAMAAKEYVLKHPRREHCKAQYIKKIRTVRQHGRELKQTVCRYMASKSGTKPTAQGHATTITGGSLTLTFTSAAWAKLDHSLGSTFTDTTMPVEPATATSGTFTFPLTGGSLNSATGYGDVMASGGITVTSTTSLGVLGSSGSNASATSPVVAIGSTSTVTMTSEQFSPPAVPLFELNTSAVTPAVASGTVTLSNVPVTLTSAGEQFFSIVGSFSSGEQVGTLTIDATS